MSGRIPLLAVLAVALSTASSGAFAAEAEISLGQLTLAYQTEDWRAEATADGVTMVCVGVLCNGSVVTATTRTDVPRCDGGVALDEMNAVYPAATRRGVNMHTVEGLAVYLAFADTGWTAENRAAVFACVDREGVRTEFRTALAEGEEPPPFHAGIVLGLLQGLSAPPATVATYRLGDLVITYGLDRWQEPDGPVEVPTLLCLPPFCNGVAELSMQAEPIAPGEVCEAFGPVQDRFATPLVQTITNDAGLTFEVTEIQSQCRAMSPSQYVACGVVGSMRYTMATEGGPGCTFGPTVPESMLLDLLANTSKVPPP